MFPQLIYARSLVSSCNAFSLAEPGRSLTSRDTSKTTFLATSHCSENKIKTTLHPLPVTSVPKVLGSVILNYSPFFFFLVSIKIIQSFIFSCPHLHSSELSTYANFLGKLLFLLFWAISSNSIFSLHIICYSLK